MNTMRNHVEPERMLSRRRSGLPLPPDAERHLADCTHCRQTDAVLEAGLSWARTSDPTHRAHAAEVSEVRIADLVAGRLEPSEALRVKRWVEGCDVCSSLAAQLRGELEVWERAGSVAASVASSIPQSASVTGRAAIAGAADRAAVAGATDPAASADATHRAATDVRRASRVIVGTITLALAGLLAFVPHGLWGMTRVTAVGFVLVLFGLLGGLALQLEGRRGARPRLERVFLGPAMAALLATVILVDVQRDDLVFLHPEWDLTFQRIVVAEHLNAPEGERDVFQQVLARVREEQRIWECRHTGKSAPSALPGRSGRVPEGRDGATSALPGGDRTAGETVESGGAPGPGALPELPGGVVVRPRTRQDVPVAKRPGAVELDGAGIESVIDQSRFLRCFDTHAGGYELPQRMTLRLRLRPDGQLGAVELTPVNLAGTGLERCMADRLRTVAFPAFEGDAPVWYEHVIVR